MKLTAWLFGVSAAAAMGVATPSFAATEVPATTAALQQRHPAMQQLLQYGDQGHWVMTLQADLQLLGFPQVGPMDGIFGPKTESGVKAFQAASGLPVTGVADAVTWQDILAGFGLVPAYQPQSSSNTQASVSTTPSGGSTPQTIDGKRVLAVYHMTATAYGPSLQDNYPYGPTDAFGDPLQAGMVAVDPSVIPLKSTVYVQGYHDAYLPSGGFVGRAMDTGGAIRGQRIDIFMNDNARIVSDFGIQPVTVYVLGN